MKRQVFFSFHYEEDCWRVQQVKNMGVVEDSTPLLSGNEWEEVKKSGDKAVEKWIDDNMKYRSCVVVLVGSKTAGRKWVKYEIEKAWNDGKGVVGIYIHNLKDASGEQSTKGRNPFEDFNVDGVKLSEIVKCYDPPFITSTYVYDDIKENIENLVEKAIEIRSRY